MQNFIFFIISALFLALISRSFLRARAAAAKMGAEPDPVRVAMMQHEAIIMALQAVERLDESPEQIAVRRKNLLEKQRNLQGLTFTPA
jgi:hypothetical protein